MSQKFRNLTGGNISRESPLDFRFNGTLYQGYQGDTLASALLANGVRLVGRSFKYHRPAASMRSASRSRARCWRFTGAT